MGSLFGAWLCTMYFIIYRLPILSSRYHFPYFKDGDAEVERGHRATEPGFPLGSEHHTSLPWERTSMLHGKQSTMLFHDDCLRFQ